MGDTRDFGDGSATADRHPDALDAMQPEIRDQCLT